jgi:hypothetical protein
VIFSLLAFGTFRLVADQIQMQNGDRYVGRLVALSNDTLVVQSDLLGMLRLPRDKVANISFGAVTGSNFVHSKIQSVPPEPLKDTAKTQSQFSTALKQLQSDTNSIRQIQQQFLGSAGPAANQKFTELAEGLMAGSINLSDLRAQAATAAEQLRALKQEGGSELGGSLDSYLAILESFLKQTPAPTASTNRTGQVKKPQAPPLDKHEEF